MKILKNLQTLKGLNTHTQKKKLYSKFPIDKYICVSYRIYWHESYVVQNALKDRYIKKIIYRNDISFTALSTLSFINKIQ